MDDTWFLDVDIEDAMAQVSSRHLANGFSQEGMERRIKENDRVNAELVLQSRKNARLIVDLREAHGYI